MIDKNEFLVYNVLWGSEYMYKRSFNIKSLPPITLENFKKYSIKEYKTNNVTLIESDNKYYLVKDIDDMLQINKNFFEFLVADKIDEVNKTIYNIPLSSKQNIIIEETKKNDIIFKKAIVYFETIEDALKFPIPKFFGKEIIDVEQTMNEQEYMNISGNEIILLFAKSKELNIDEETKNELLELYIKVINSNNDNEKPITISINKDSEIISLLGYNEKVAIKKMI